MTTTAKEGHLVYLTVQKQPQQQQQQRQPKVQQYLLGLMPQRNWWSIFKSLLDEDADDGKTPHQIALWDFAKETRMAKAFTLMETVLNGTMGSGKNKKDVVIYLQNGAHISMDNFVGYVV